MIFHRLTLAKPPCDDVKWMMMVPAYVSRSEGSRFVTSLYALTQFNTNELTLNLSPTLTLTLNTELTLTLTEVSQPVTCLGMSAQGIVPN